MELTKVLVADDEPTIRALLETNLMIEGFASVAARDGREALEKISRERPDLVLLDLMMPDMDGWQVLDRLRQWTKRPKVIVLSAKASDSSKLEGLQRGCDEYVTKPFDLDDLFGKIHAIGTCSVAELERRRVAAIEELQRA